MTDPFAPVPKDKACTQIYRRTRRRQRSRERSAASPSTPSSTRATAARSRAGTACSFSFRPPDVALRVTHCPVNLAGVGWTNVQALRKRGVDARLVVFNTQPFRPDQADWDLKRPRTGPSAPAARPVAGALEAPAADGHLPLLLRADARPEAPAVPDPESDAPEVALPLPRRGHPRAAEGAAPVRAQGGRARRRLVRGAQLHPVRRGSAAAGHRPRRSTSPSRRSSASVCGSSTRPRTTRRRAPNT